MKFLMMVRSCGGQESGRQQDPDYLARMDRYCAEMRQAGVLLSTGGLAPLSEGARLKSENGKITVTDGPFAEAKEVIGGFAVIEAKSKAEAIEMGKRFLEVSGSGDLEIRHLIDES